MRGGGSVSVGVAGLALLAFQLVLTLPIVSIEHEGAFLHEPKATHNGGVHVAEVVPEAGVE